METLKRHRVEADCGAKDLKGLKRLFFAALRNTVRFLGGEHVRIRHLGTLHLTCVGAFSER